MGGDDVDMSTAKSLMCKFQMCNFLSGKTPMHVADPSPIVSHSELRTRCWSSLSASVVRFVFSNLLDNVFRSHLRLA